MTENTARIPSPEELQEQRLKRFREHPGLRELDRDIERDEEERRKEEERKEAQFEKAREEKAASEIEVLKQETREHFIESGGTAKEFEKAWPELRQDIIRQRTLERVQTARQKASEVFRSQF